MSIAYVPILKAKEGEYAALGALDLHVRLQVTPLLEIPSVPYDYLNERPLRTVEEHVRGIAHRIRSSWGEDRPVYIDYSAHSEEEVLTDGTHAFANILAEAIAAKVQAIPVIYTSSSADAIQAVSSYAQKSGLGVCIRLVISDFDEEVDLEERIGKMIEDIALSDGDVDIILDLKELQSDVQRGILLLRAMLAALPRPAEWRRVIVAASSFPEDLRDVEASSVVTLPRREWDLWNALQRRPERLPRRDIVFSDYGIAHPSLKDVDPRLMTMSASIRYTGRNEWVIVKGRGVRQSGFEQYHALCQRLVQHPAYEGASFSWGDRYIAETAVRTTGPGNATTWRKVGTNHHITLVALQLSMNPGS
jgi:hypothetical protein